MRVGGEITRGAKALKFRAQLSEMGVGGVHHMDVWQGKPSFELMHHIRDGEGSLDNPAIRGDTHEPEHRGPGQADALSA